jgi:hypothetical protein
MTEELDIGASVQGSPHPAWLAHSNGRCVHANPERPYRLEFDTPEADALAGTRN